ncbi:TIGR02452 family protein [Paenibacillus soyae]|nr:TIGR02452 family protein [Paenibacillus soyae]
MDRQTAARTAEETIAIIREGSYRNRRGEVIELGGALERSVRDAILYSPADGDRCLAEANLAESFRTKIEVTPETTLQAAGRLAGEGRSVCCLNFASARQPGGGFLNGARAQEESLARSSGLYPTIVQMTEMYEENARVNTCLYTDYMIYSPEVPVFREDGGELLDRPYSISVITAPAVNAGVVRDREPENAGRIREVMTRRIEKIAAVALANGQTSMILGTFGCGVFKNDPEEVASIFREVLQSDRWRDAFEYVVFAVYDTTPKKRVYESFRRALGTC